MSRYTDESYGKVGIISFSSHLAKLSMYYLESRLTDLCTISHHFFFKLFFLDILQQKNLKHIIFRVGNLTHNLTHHSHQPRKLQTTPEFFFVLPRLEIPHEILGDKFSKKNNKAEDFFLLVKTTQDLFSFGI